MLPPRPHAHPRLARHPRHSVPRYFFFAIVRTDMNECTKGIHYLCDGPLKGVTVALDMHNVVAGERNEFSADEYGVLPITIAFVVGEAVVFVFMIYISIALCGLGKWHHTVRMLLAVIVIQLAGLLVYMVKLVNYDKTGRASPVPLRHVAPRRYAYGRAHHALAAPVPRPRARPTDTPHGHALPLCARTRTAAQMRT